MAESIGQSAQIDKLNLTRSGISDFGLCQIIENLPAVVKVFDISYNIKLNHENMKFLDKLIYHLEDHSLRIQDLILEGIALNFN